MNTRKLRNYTNGALGFAAVTVAASLAAIGCAGTSSGADLATVGGSRDAAPPTITQSLPRLLGRSDRPLSAGVYLLDLTALEVAPDRPAHVPKIALTLPSGWQSYHGYAVTNDRGGAGVMGLAFWDVDQVYGTPCRWKSKRMVDPGTTVDGLAAALSRQPLRNATVPTNFVLSGALGKYLRLSVPRHIDFARCDKGYFESWTGLGWARDRWEQGPGQVDRVWILNVDGQRLVVDANYLPSATRADRAELDRVVHSIRFLRAGETASDTTMTGPVQGRGRGRTVVRNGRWIAYSTAHASDWKPGSSYGPRGSDVFMTRAGDLPKPVASRGSGVIWNLCPAFSPNGRRLAFATISPSGSEIIVVRIFSRDGTIGARRVVVRLSARQALCPRWSLDSSRVAYLDRNRGKVIVRDLDGSKQHRTKGDPTAGDFVRNPHTVLSPTGRLIARTLSGWKIAVFRRDGSGRRVIKDNPTSYAIGGWSPDARKLLLMRDVGGGFLMRAVSVDPPFTSTTVVANVTVNNARSWPGYGDVSWQPRASFDPRTRDR